MGGLYNFNDSPGLLVKPQYSYGDDKAQYEQQLAAYNAQQSALESSMPQVKTKEQFMATVKPEMLNANGTFKAPKDGVNFAYEGMTPDQVYAAYLQQVQKAGDPGVMQDGPDKSSIGYWNSRSDIAGAAGANLDAGWREGPDNGGGALGGFTRSIGSLAKGIASNPALMAAITAGVGSALSSGVQSATGWSAGTSKAVSSGIINGAKTLANGGNLTDMAKSAVLSAAGGVAGNAVGVEVKDFTGSPIAAKIASDLTNTAVKGGDLASTLVTSGTGLAVNEITSNIDGFDKLSELQKGIINSAISSAIRGKKITPGLIADIMTKTQQTVKKAKA